MEKIRPGTAREIQKWWWKTGRPWVLPSNIAAKKIDKCFCRTFPSYFPLIFSRFPTFRRLFGGCKPWQTQQTDLNQKPFSGQGICRAHRGAMWLQHSSRNPGGRTAGGLGPAELEVGGLKNHEPCAKFSSFYSQPWKLGVWGFIISGKIMMINQTWLTKTRRLKDDVEKSHAEPRVLCAHFLGKSYCDFQVSTFFGLRIAIGFSTMAADCLEAWCCALYGHCRNRTTAPTAPTAPSTEVMERRLSQAKGTCGTANVRFGWRETGLLEPTTGVDHDFSRFAGHYSFIAIAAIYRYLLGKNGFPQSFLRANPLDETRQGQS